MREWRCTHAFRINFHLENMELSCFWKKFLQRKLSSLQEKHRTTRQTSGNSKLMLKSATCFPNTQKGAIIQTKFYKAPVFIIFQSSPKAFTSIWTIYPTTGRIWKVNVISIHFVAKVFNFVEELCCNNLSTSGSENTMHRYFMSLYNLQFLASPQSQPAGWLIKFFCVCCALLQTHAYSVCGSAYEYYFYEWI